MRATRPSLVALLLAACGARADDDAGTLAVTDVLAGEDTAGYARAIAPRAFRFPDDHGPHPDFRNEWWYFTGNLATATGRRFGFHVTFFRVALRPDDVAHGGSAWRTRQLWMAHFALADVAAGRVHAAERFARGALDLAGAQATPFAVNVDEWSVRSAGAGFAPLVLRAADGDAALDLELRPEKPPVLQGDAGLSRKSATPGNASYYYSIPRLAARGTVTTADGTRHAVTGGAWFDREWSTSALDPDQVGWDWLALQLADGRDLMYYRLRRHDGTTDPASAGVVVAPDGAVTRLTSDDVELAARGTWRSPRSGADYPAGFALTVPRLALALTVTPLLADQELDLTLRYWEGAVEVAGTVAGRGYLEMTGYADRRAGAR